MREPHRLERARLGVERLLVLGEVADPDRRADPDLALGRLELADDGLQQHALAGAVRADEADALAVHDGQLDVREHDVVAELRSPTWRSSKTRWPPRTCGCRRSAILRRSSTGRSTFSIRSICRCLLRACLMWRSSTTRLRPVLEAADRRLEPLDLLLLRDVLLLLALQLELAGERVGGVVARPHPDPARGRARRSG